MSYPGRAAQILRHMGYEPDVDFEASEAGGVVSLDWYHTDPKPTDADVLAQEVPTGRGAVKRSARAEARLRIYAVNPADFEGLVQDLRRHVEILDHWLENGSLNPGRQNKRTNLNARESSRDAIDTALNAMLSEIDTLSHEADFDAYIEGIADDVASAPRTVEWP